MSGERARYFPQMPPDLPGEDNDAYTNRLTGALGEDRRPYDHPRNRQCSIGYHGECSNPSGRVCKCPCHTAEGKLEMRVWELEESVVSLWAVASGSLPEPGSKRPGWDQRIIAGENVNVSEITARRPKLAEWYLRTTPASTGTDTSKEQ